MVSTPACHAGGQGFEPPSGRQTIICGSDVCHCHIYESRKRNAMRNASVAQVVEQGTENPCVGGSSPPRGTNYAGVAQQAEQLICNQ